MLLLLAHPGSCPLLPAPPGTFAAVQVAPGEGESDCQTYAKRHIAGSMQTTMAIRIPMTIRILMGMAIRILMAMCFAQVQHISLHWSNNMPFCIGLAICLFCISPAICLSA